MAIITEKIVQNYLESKLKREVRILEFSFIGEGFYANGYKVVYEVGGEKKTDFVRVIKPMNSGHEYPIDRAMLLVTSKEISDGLSKVPKVSDVVGFDKDGKTCAIAGNIEYFSIGEYVEGAKEYMLDLERIAKRKKLADSDITRALGLSDYLVEAHKKKFINGKSSEEEINLARSLYKRATREIVSNNELTMGILDIDWNEKDWGVSKNEIYDLVRDALVYHEGIKNNYQRLSRIHGDFWDKNILFKNGKLIASDTSRFVWGEPAIDIATLVARYMNFDLRNFGNLSGIFSKLAGTFVENYLKKTGDEELLKVFPYVFSFNALVSSHPAFHPELSVELRRSWIGLGRSMLKDGQFDWKNMDKYLI